jgi:2-methylcitrate dehydratase PrpD
LVGMSHTAAILNFAAAPHVLPDAVRADAVRLLADTLAVMAAGAASLEAKKLSNALNTVSAEPVGAEGDAQHQPRGGLNRASTSSALTVFGEGSLDGSSAAFFNGFAIHCLEWDAVHEPAVVHALSVVTAALLAASDRRGGSDPEAFLTALTVGVDIASGLGVAATGPMRFFRPATAGAVGAALAVARLDGLSQVQMADVLGLAYSFAGGTMQAHVEGSIALPLQIGRAAQAAMHAVDMVKAGLSGPHDVLEGPFGYAALIEPLELSRYTQTLGQIWRISEVSIKPYPSGRASHAILAALDEVRGSQRGVSKITAYVPPLIQRLVGRPYRTDMTPAYARLCLPLLCALMLRTGRIDPRSFTAETFADPIIQQLAAMVTVELDDNPDGNALGPQRLVAEHADGSVSDITIPHTLGSPKAPLSITQAAQKYEMCRVLAGYCDPRLFDDPLSYATDPR